MPQPPSQHRASSRSGFTLIEILIALALSVVLISGIYTAVSLHWRYEEVGRERISRSQVTLAVLRMMSDDVGSVAFVPPEAVPEDEEAGTASTTSTATSTTGSTTTGSTGSTTGSTGTSSTTTTTEETSTTTKSAQVSLGVVGTADILQLDISQPTRLELATDTEEDSTASSGVLSAPSDSLRVSWGLVGADAETAASQEPGAASMQLARQAVDRLRGAVAVEDSAETEVTLSSSGIIAPEVVSLTFRYFDGYTWNDQWDSVEMQRLPRAIEVTMGFRKTTFQRGGSLNPLGQEPLVMVKHVILVPVSTPNSGAEL